MKTVKNFLSKKVCDHLIHCHRQWFPQDLGEHIKKYHRNTETLLFENLMIRDSIMRQVYCKLIAFVKKAHPELYINHTEIVRWPTGKGQGPHLDFEDSTYTTLIYLNDNYKGGETYVNKRTIKPETGKLIFFAGNKKEHGVHDVRQGERYTIPSWWNTL